jgi:hypothetical protein
MRYLVLSIGHNHWQQTVLVDHTLNLLESGHEVHWVQVSYFGYSSWDEPISLLLNNFVNRGKISRIARLLRAYPKFSIEFRCLTKYPILTTSKFLNDYETQGAVKEEIVTILRDSLPCGRHTQKLNKHLSTKFDLSQQFFIQIIKSTDPDYVVIFNGRFLLERSAWLASLKNSKNVIFIERFSAQWSDRYYEFHHPVHSVSDRSLAMMLYPESQEGVLNSANAVGREWFSNRRLALTQKFTSHQTVQFTRPDWATTLISFFHSSEDELFVSDLSDSSWVSQFEVIKSLVEICNSRPGHLLVVRLHPNLLNKSNRELKKWYVFAGVFTADNVKFLMPNDDVNSYSVVDKSDYVVTSGSTIGVEAVYMRKPSLLCGLAFHQDMGMLEIVSNPEALGLSLSKKYPSELLESRAEISLKYAFFLAQAGIRVKNLNKVGSAEIQDPWFEYYGVKLKPFRLVSLIKKIESSFYSKFQISRNCNCGG